MQFFHIAVLGVSSIILLIVLIYIGISLYNAKKKYGVPRPRTPAPTDGCSIPEECAKCRRPETWGYNHVGRHNRDKQPDKSNGCGVLCPNQPTGCRRPAKPQYVLNTRGRTNTASRGTA
jgi:hypothetical protein